MFIPRIQTHNAYIRYCQRQKDRERNLRLIAEQKYLQIDSPERINKFFSRRGISDKNIESVKNELGFIKQQGFQPSTYKKLERMLGTNDLVNINFLEAALNYTATVGRIWICDHSGKVLGYGTGFMVSPTLMLTNHHVLPDSSIAKLARLEFNYQLDINNNILKSETFSLDVDKFYDSFEDLDFALVAVKPYSNNGVHVSSYGYNKLSRDEGKTIISQWLNIVQHPGGMPKQIGIRENQLIDVLEQFLHYRTDTAAGSSGSPVFNEQWEVVALHHSGVWEEDKMGNILDRLGNKWNPTNGEDEIKWIANEGVRISTILNRIQKQNYNPVSAQLVDELLNPPLVKQKTFKNINQPNNKKYMENSELPSEIAVNNDGSVTWNVPLSITIKVGGHTATIPISGSTNQENNAVATDHKVDAGSRSEILRSAKEKFGKRADVLNVRLGYQFKNGWITKERAIVVTVKSKKSSFELAKEGVEALSDNFMGYPVEVTSPTIQDLISISPQGKNLESILLAKSDLANEITYVKPTGLTLKKVNGVKNYNFHVSPEEGWINLNKFLSGTKRSLTIGMYDFGAPHVLNALLEAIDKKHLKEITLVIQPGESVGRGTKKDDYTDEEIVKELKKALGKNFKNAWIKIGRVNGWISTSYHIKVLVKDGESFWLSSGNLQSSNQPNLSDIANNSQAFLLKNYNREWHAIINNKELASMFEGFIKHDFENNKNYKPTAKEFVISDELNILVPKIEPLAEEALATSKPFKPFTSAKPITVMPLLTPDNFYEVVLDLVKSAKEEILIQNQTFNAPKNGQEKLEELINAVLEKQQQGVKVRIIYRVLMASVARENLEALADMGFDTDFIKLQKNCHTKGVIVDGDKVLLGSQNWSADGISMNRDASLLVEDAGVAQYFRKIFEHDWSNIAKHNIGKETGGMELATDINNIPPGMEMITWSDIREML
jgi:V8-like Glu-specific endopeptidase